MVKGTVILFFYDIKFVGRIEYGVTTQIYSFATKQQPQTHATTTASTLQDENIGPRPIFLLRWSDWIQNLSIKEHWRYEINISRYTSTIMEYQCSVMSRFALKLLLIRATYVKYAISHHRFPFPCLTCSLAPLRVFPLPIAFLLSQTIIEIPQHSNLHNHKFILKNTLSTILYCQIQIATVTTRTHSHWS